MLTTCQSSSARLLLNAGVWALLIVAPTAHAQTNTATGTDALTSNTTGVYNTADGYQALYSNTTGSNNMADGYKALFSNTTASFNTANGSQALYSNTTGSQNTAAGTFSLNENTTGSLNTANGSYALSDNAGGSYNTANGASSLAKNTSGSNNTTDGAYSLYFNTTGSYNTADGRNALYKNTIGSTNIALGYRAGFNNTTGSNNIAIGNEASSVDSGVIRIGTSGTQTQTYIAGISGATASGGVPVYINTSGQLGTIVSSQRFKEDIHSVGSLSDKLLQLRPVSFRYKQAAEDGTHPRQYGLIAEEVARVFPELVQYDKEGEAFTVYYHLLTPLLLSELQKEHQQNVAQQAELVAFKKQEAQQQAELTSLKQHQLAQQQQQAAQMAALQIKLNQLDRLVQASNPTITSAFSVGN